MKRRLPVTVWQAIQPLIDEYRPLVIPVMDEDVALTLKDSNPDSDFYFRCHPMADTGRYQVEHKPQSQTYNGLNRQDVELKDLVMWLRQWLEVLDAYDKLQTVYDDPVLQGYEREFASYFVLADADEFEPMDFSGQRYLIRYLDQVNDRLRHQQSSAPDHKAEQIGGLLRESETLKNEMPELSKNQTVRRLIKIWSKARKFSVDLVVDLLTEFKKEGLKLLVKGALDVGGSNASDFWNTL